MNRYAVLLRGVMPTGKNKVPMAQLREILVGAGLDDVSTYIQTGNVVCTSSLTHSDIEVLVHKTILKEIGADISVFARTHQQLSKIVNNNPFKIDEPQKQYFTIYNSAPDSALLKAFKTSVYEPDQVIVKKCAIYTLYATKHSDSKFSNNYFERKLKVSMTTRNFNTINKLLALCQV